MKNKSIICLTLSIFMLITCCACAAEPLDRAKIAEFNINESLLYDSFYSMENIYYDLDDDFDLAFCYFIALYDPERSVVGFNLGISMYPKYEKTIKDYGMLIMVDEKLRDLIETSNNTPTPQFTDSEIKLDDSYLFLTYKPYDTDLGMIFGSTFYSIPLEEFSEEEIIKMVREGLYLRVFKNKKLNPLKKLTYDGKIINYEETLDPNGSQEAFSKARRNLLPLL
jgi:hypothetical protein